MPKRSERWAFDRPRDTPGGKRKLTGRMDADRSYSCVTVSPLVAALCSFLLVSMFLSDISPNFYSLALCALRSDFFEDFWAVNDGEKFVELFSVLRDSTEDGPGGVRPCQQEVTHEVTKENHKYISVAKSSSGQNSPLRLKISSFCHARSLGTRECSLLPDISTK